MIRQFATDMYEPFRKAIRADPALAQAAHVYDPFHVIKRAGEAVIGSPGLSLRARTRTDHIAHERQRARGVPPTQKHPGRSS
jgi:hypothetical protein